mgnify:CR=1 FL=1
MVKEVRGGGSFFYFATGDRTEEKAENFAKEIDDLVRADADELAAVHQYMYFHFRLDDLGYGPLANLLKMTAIEEMQHAEMVAERILFLGGEVEMVVGREVVESHGGKVVLVPLFLGLALERPVRAAGQPLDVHRHQHLAVGGVGQVACLAGEFHRAPINKAVAPAVRILAAWAVPTR